MPQQLASMVSRHSTAQTDLLRRRPAGQFLTTAGLKTAADVVRALGAVQAQDYAGAKWAVAQRTTGATEADVERELAAGRILRTHVGTSAHADRPRRMTLPGGPD